MAIRGRPIPEIQGIADPKVKEILLAMKDNIERMAGAGSTPSAKTIQTLGAGATLSGVINKVNEMLKHLQGT